MSFLAKQSEVLNNQLKVQRLVLPFKITSNATPASKTLTVDDPSILFLKVEGIDQITAALAAADTAPTFATATDSTGVFNILVKIQEKVKKVCSCQLVKRNGQEVLSATLPSAPSTGIVAGGALDKIALNVDSATNFSSADYDACVIVEYIVDEQ